MNRTGITLLLLIVGTMLFGAAYLAGVGTKQDINFKSEVVVVSVPDRPLCGETRTTNCAASKVDWNTLQVHSAPGITRTVVGDKFLPNAKE